MGVGQNAGTGKLPASGKSLLPYNRGACGPFRQRFQSLLPRITGIGVALSDTSDSPQLRIAGAAGEKIHHFGELSALFQPEGGRPTRRDFRE